MKLYPEKAQASEWFLACARADNWICGFGFTIVPLSVYVAAPEFIKRHGKTGSTPDGMRWLALGLAIFFVFKLIINLKARKLTLAWMVPAVFACLPAIYATLGMLKTMSFDIENMIGHFFVIALVFGPSLGVFVYGLYLSVLTGFALRRIGA